MDYKAQLQTRLGEIQLATPVNPTLRERLKMNLEMYQSKVAEAQEALALLDKNPEYERLADLLTRVAY